MVKTNNSIAPLFDKVKNRKVTAYDFFGKKRKRLIGNFKFRPSAYGVLREGNKVLVQKPMFLSELGLPGGGINVDESIKEGLAREYKEETGLNIEVGKILGVGEDYFTCRGVDVYGILIYFEVKKVGGTLLTNGNGKDTSEVKFVELKSLNKKNTTRSQWNFIENLRPQ